VSHRPASTLAGISSLQLLAAFDPHADAPRYFIAEDAHAPFYIQCIVHPLGPRSRFWGSASASSIISLRWISRG
jgi:hypothetical protein